MHDQRLLQPAFISGEGQINRSRQIRPFGSVIGQIAYRTVGKARFRRSMGIAGIDDGAQSAHAAACGQQRRFPGQTQPCIKGVHNIVHIADRRQVHPTPWTIVGPNGQNIMLRAGNFKGSRLRAQGDRVQPMKIQRHRSGRAQQQRLIGIGKLVHRVRRDNRQRVAHLGSLSYWMGRIKIRGVSSSPCPLGLSAIAS